MLEVIEEYRPQLIAALTHAGSEGLTVRELRERLGTSEQVIRRTLGVLTATGAVSESYRHVPGVRGAVPRVYTLAQPNTLTPTATQSSTAERE